MKKKKPYKKEKVISTIILASGASQRFGSCKYVEKINGIPLIYWSLRPFIKLSEKYKTIITLVAGPFYDTFIQLMKNNKEPFYNRTIQFIEEKDIDYDLSIIGNLFSNKKSSKGKSLKLETDKNIIKINICKNENFEKGMFSSYKKGLNLTLKIFKNKMNFTKFNKAIIISLADMPFIKPEIILNLIDKLNSKFIDYSVPYFKGYTKILNKALNTNKIIQGKKGHPIALKPSFALKISKFDDKITLRDALKIGKIKLLKTEDKSVLIDIDKKEDIDIIKTLIY
ncbi:MAG: hypothetical protein WH035_02235 [Spirochaetota bacterium]